MATDDLETAHVTPGAEDNSPTAAAASSKKRKSSITEIEIDVSQPEPPSKKAKRALKKGKPLPKKAGSDDEAAAEGDDKDEKKDGTKKKERSPYGVWIGNLRFTVTKAELRQWFVDNSGGAITDDMITRVHLPMTKTAAGLPKKAATENRGFAYVDFVSLEANTAAIALSETEWHRRKVLIKDSKSYEGRPKVSDAAAKAAREDGAAPEEDGGAKKKNPCTKIFVGNLSFTTTEDDLQAHFEKCGKIRWVKVATFEDTGKCKGYGWVNFEDAEAAQWAFKGFVKVREVIDTLEDFVEDDDVETKEEEGASSGDDKEEEGKEKKKKPAKKEEKEPARIKTRKWWVNQLLGRNLKIELAEDDQLRYQKRFKKGGSKNKEQQKSDGGDAAEGGEKPKVWERKSAAAPKYESDINVARLTGAAVAPQGKKTTFE
ncbi:hypothetical protein B0H66DRAFT_493237 [Apodospora peruviana]|uniref:RRM domain-containing protein n=1 Tax=Apodospora peruviana TaxID=516989 RepID=A0AAE0IJW9_9PEZI|nr:hypothetical protein B0H66DRAFT_493237 [Apodospora peruviana]